MDIATGAMNTLLPKLAELVAGEYKLQKGVKGEIKELGEELASMSAALHKVAEVSLDQLDDQVKIWARDVRELSYDIEDEVDSFMLRGKEHGHEPFSLKRLIGKVINLINKMKTNHQMHNAIKDVMDQVKKVAERRGYQIDNIVISKKAENTTAKLDIVSVDPRLETMYTKATELVGISGPKHELAKRLLEQDLSSPSSRQQSNIIISIVGFGGLGKTTLANSLFQDLKSKFDCHIFVSVSLNPDIMMIFKNIILQLNDTKCVCKDEPWEMKQLIDRIRYLLKNKKCLCVIDDLWKESAWDAIKLAFQDGDPGSKIIITTRNRNVAEHVGGSVYELKPLSNDDSRKMLNKRVFDTEDGCPPSYVEVTGKIIKKCGGVPLAIITTASLLASKPMCLEEWEQVNKSIGSGLGNSIDVDKMRKILSLSYNDLPFHLKTCLLSLSKYPEDHLIRKDVLVWSWIAEGFIKQETKRAAGTSLQQIAESYFNDLMNRSLIQPAQGFDLAEDGQVHCCQVHDMVLELISQLSAEEGFVSTLLLEDDQQATTQRRKIRRLSIHNNSIEFESYAASPKQDRKQLFKVRSLDIFGKTTVIPPLSRFCILRVLQVDNCFRLDSSHLNDLGKLRLLRFLRLHELEIDELPESIGELESLETLDIRRQNRILPRPRPMLVLPVSFPKLRKLIRLISNGVELPNGLTLENMTSLRELVGMRITLNVATEVGKLRELKVLGLYMGEVNALVTKVRSNVNELIVKCLQLCPCLHVFILRDLNFSCYPVDLMEQLPSCLQTFTSYGGCFEKEFPKWNKAQLSYLTVLRLNLKDVCVLPEHLEQLAELPSLHSLMIEKFQSNENEKLSCEKEKRSSEKEQLSCASGFPCLTYLDLEAPNFFLKFQHGAMLKLQKLRFESAFLTTKEYYWPTSIFDSGLENLRSLRHVVIELPKYCAEAEDAFRKAVNDHPNHPSLYLSFS